MELRDFAQRTELLLFYFLSPFIESHDYTVGKAMSTSAHAPF